MTKVLVVDDDWEWVNLHFNSSPSFHGMEIVGFENISEALKYLKNAAPKDYPNICILDTVVVSRIHFLFSDREAGLRAAQELDAFFYQKNHRIDAYYFKSNDDSFAENAVDRFKEIHPDLSVGTISSPHGLVSEHFRIMLAANSPIDVPSALKEIFASVTRIPRMDIYDVHAPDLGMLHAVWDDLDEIHGKEDTPAIEFSFGGGRPKTGRVISSMDGFEKLSRDDLAVFVCDQIPNGILEHRNRLAAIIVTGENKIPGHIRIILKPHDISLLVGAQGDISGLEELQHVTVAPQEQKLYLGQLPIVMADSALPKIVDAIQDMKAIVRNRIERANLRFPRFLVNVSSPLLRVIEHFVFYQIGKCRVFFSLYLGNPQVLYPINLCRQFESFFRI